MKLLLFGGDFFLTMLALLTFRYFSKKLLSCVIFSPPPLPPSYSYTPPLPPPLSLSSPSHTHSLFQVCHFSFLVAGNFLITSEWWDPSFFDVGGGLLASSWKSEKRGESNKRRRRIKTKPKRRRKKLFFISPEIVLVETDPTTYWSLQKLSGVLYELEDHHQLAKTNRQTFKRPIKNMKIQKWKLQIRCLIKNKYLNWNKPLKCALAKFPVVIQNVAFS